MIPGIPTLSSALSPRFILLFAVLSPRCGRRSVTSPPGDALLANLQDSDDVLTRTSGLGVFFWHGSHVRTLHKLSTTIPSSHYYLRSLSWTSETFYFPDSRDLLEVLGDFLDREREGGVPRGSSRTLGIRPGALSLPRRSSENLDEVPRIWEGEGSGRSEILNASNNDYWVAPASATSSTNAPTSQRHQQVQQEQHSPCHAPPAQHRADAVAFYRFLPCFTDFLPIFTDFSDLLGRLQPSKTAIQKTPDTLGVE